MQNSDIALAFYFYEPKTLEEYVELARAISKTAPSKLRL